MAFKFKRSLREPMSEINVTDARVDRDDLIRGNVAEQGPFQEFDALRQTRQGPRRVGRQDRRPEEGRFILQILVHNLHAERRVVLGENSRRGELEARRWDAAVAPVRHAGRELLEERRVGAGDVVERRRGVGLAAARRVAVALRLERQDAARQQGPRQRGDHRMNPAREAAVPRTRP